MKLSDPVNARRRGRSGILCRSGDFLLQFRCETEIPSGPRRSGSLLISAIVQQPHIAGYVMDKELFAEQPLATDAPEAIFVGAAHYRDKS